MATVTVFTASRMEAIEAASIVSGTVNGNGDLILTRHDNTTVNAGNVIGPEGPQGPVGEVTQEELEAAIAAAHAAGAITEEQLATGAVTAIKIGTGAVTEIKIATGAVTNSKVATGISASKIEGIYYKNGSTSQHQITISTALPSGGSDGDIWMRY